MFNHAGYGRFFFFLFPELSLFWHGNFVEGSQKEAKLIEDLWCFWRLRFHRGFIPV
jgi:hypothetical protein